MQDPASAALHEFSLLMMATSSLAATLFLMSNCIKIPQFQYLMPAKWFHMDKLSTSQTDMDGNSIYVTKKGLIFTPAHLTTYRELRVFILTHISPALKGVEYAYFRNVRDEYDDYLKQFTLKICLLDGNAK